MVTNNLLNSCNVQIYIQSFSNPINGPDIVLKTVKKKKNYIFSTQNDSHNGVTVGLFYTSCLTQKILNLFIYCQIKSVKITHLAQGKNYHSRISVVLLLHLVLRINTLPLDLSEKCYSETKLQHYAIYSALQWTPLSHKMDCLGLQVFHLVWDVLVIYLYERKMPTGWEAHWQTDV